MMSVRLRYLPMLLRWAFLQRGKGPMVVSRLHLRCWPSDLDINRHMNNSRYLALMDMGRWHFLLAAGMAPELKKRGWLPVLVKAEIDFRHSIKPFQAFELETSLERVGTKSCTIKQRFLVGGKEMAVARVVGLFVGEGRSQVLVTLMESLPHLKVALQEAGAEGLDQVAGMPEGLPMAATEAPEGSPEAQEPQVPQLSPEGQAHHPLMG